MLSGKYCLENVQVHSDRLTGDNPGPTPPCRVRSTLPFLNGILRLGLFAGCNAGFELPPGKTYRRDRDCDGLMLASRSLHVRSTGKALGTRGSRGDRG